MLPNPFMENIRSETNLKPSSIRTMPDVLTWQNNQEVLSNVHESWVALINNALWAKVSLLNQQNQTVGEALIEGFRSLNSISFERVLLAPETIFRLLPGRNTSLNETADFLWHSILAEMARENPGFDVEEELWTALGDARVDANGVFVMGSQVSGLMPLDFDSPYSRQLDLSGTEYRVSKPRPPLDGADLQYTLAMLEQVRDTLATTNPSLQDFVVRFTKVLILQKDESQPFSSGSNGDYVGRSVISNPQSVTVADLADGIVHEAIHSLLYMQEEQQSWVQDVSFYEPVGRITSPWTGRLLPVRPFLQACFVWYGLVNFWATAGQQATFEITQVQRFFQRSALGFLKGPLIDHLITFRSGLTTDILDTIIEMQSRVETSLRDYL